MSEENKAPEASGEQPDNLRKQGESENPSSSTDVAGMTSADSEPKPGEATPEQQEKASELQNADPAKQTTSEPSDPPAAEAVAPAVDPEREAKLKAAAEARAARAAAKAAAAQAEGGEGAAPAEGADADKEAKAKVAAEARAARAAARAAAQGGGDPAAPKEPSPKQPILDRLLEIIKENVSPEAVEEAAINERDVHIPTVVVKVEHWLAVAELVKQHSELKLNYLRQLAGVDMETHMEVVYHLISLSAKQDYCFKVRTNRDQPSIPSVTPIWMTANWNEREVYDLFGIDFPGHPDLRRIMMSDDWVGHPLRKDYEPLDPEV